MLLPMIYHTNPADSYHYCIQTILPKHAITVLTLVLQNPDTPSLENSVAPDQLASDPHCFP